MPWKEHGVMEERFRFIEEWNSEEFSLAELCRFYGISRGTGYKWIGRYAAQGLEGLRELSRAPHHHLNEISQEIEEQVLGIREQHPSWGAPKIHGKLVEIVEAESTGGKHYRSHSETQRTYGESQTTTPQPACQRAAGACRSAECSVVRRL